MAKGTMLGLPGPHDPMFQERWGISFVRGPRKPGTDPTGGRPGAWLGAASTKIEDPQAREDEPEGG